MQREGCCNSFKVVGEYREQIPDDRKGQASDVEMNMFEIGKNSVIVLAP